MIYLLALVVAVGILMFFRGLALAPSQDLLETRLAQFRDQTVTLEEIELRQPFSERFLRPGMERLGAFFNSRVGRDRVTVLQNKLALAGRPGNLTVNGFLSVKLVVGVIVGVLVYFLCSLAKIGLPILPGFLKYVGTGILFGFLGYLFP
ncbi:MAG: hypothetical protein ACYDGR_16665, partial [Candidatus Dormibacteria bacterium]